MPKDNPLTEDKKTDAADEAKTAAEAQPAEPLVLGEDGFEKLLLSCVWDVLNHMRSVAMKSMTGDEAAEADDALARHLARTLMDENDACRLNIPLKGVALVEMLKVHAPEKCDPSHLPKDADPSNPRAVLVGVCRAFLQDVYHRLNELAKRDDFTPELVKTQTEGLDAQWANLFMGRTKSDLN